MIIPRNVFKKFVGFLQIVICFVLALVLTSCTSLRGNSESGGEFGYPSTNGKGIKGDMKTKAMHGGSGFVESGTVGANQANRLQAPYDQTYYFDFDKFDVCAADVESINVQADYLAAHQEAKIRIEGHADERGSREYNVALGWKRARAVADILEQQGVAKSQMALISYGKEKPVAFGHDEESYKLNRRVNLVYENK